MPSKETTRDQTYVTPWRNGWLELATHAGWMRWLPSLGITVESVRILGGMTVVTFNHSVILMLSQRLLDAYPTSSSGYRQGSDSSLSVFWQTVSPPRTSLSRSATHSFATLPDIAVEASPTLQALRQECLKQLGRA